MPRCRSLTTGLMHLTNNLTMEFISVAFPFTVKCTYSPAVELFLQDMPQLWGGLTLGGPLQPTGIPDSPFLLTNFHCEADQ